MATPPEQPQQQLQQAEEQAEQQAALKNQILAQVLDQTARARLTTLTLAKPSKGSAVESLLIQMARSGQIRGKIDEEGLIGLLERVEQNQQGGTNKVKFDRRRVVLDSEDEDNYDDL